MNIFDSKLQCPGNILIITLFCIAILLCNPLTAYNWQKWKRVFLTCPCHEIYGDEAVDLTSCKYTWKIKIFCENVKFGAISWKFDILSITA